MDLGISGRRAAVAAGSAGLGLAIATRLAQAGVEVAVCGRDESRLDGALESLRTAHSGSSSAALTTPGPQAFTADVSNPAGAQEFVERAAEALGGPLDILVCNGGGPPPGTATTTSIDAYRGAFEANCLASIAMCEQAVPHMRGARWGRILGITSIGARQPIGYLAASSVARAGLTSYLKMLSTEIAADGVTVNNLQPGLHRTDRVTGLAGDQADALLSGIPTGTLGEADDFGAVAAFLCSQHASFVTGVGLQVDGGAFGGLQ
ncbi:MAG: SDR family oxidoreductase [Microthrixaceae bacterium]